MYLMYVLHHYFMCCKYLILCKCVQNSVSPMISPGSSPRFIRRSTTPTGIQPGVIPPPLPPRKNSPTLEQNSMPTTSQVPSVSAIESSLQKHLNNGLNEAQSVNNVTHETIDISPISKSNSMQEVCRDGTENGNIVELSSPQTICGVIISDCNNIINTKTQTRHQSCPSSKSKQHAHCPVKSNTTPNITSKNSEAGEDHVYENVHIEVPPKHKERYNPLTAKDNATVCYENLNMDYIKKLVSEGYSRDSVIKALGITRNNIDMACDILHEFGTKLG